MIEITYKLAFVISIALVCYFYFVLAWIGSRKESICEFLQDVIDDVSISYDVSCDLWSVIVSSLICHCNIIRCIYYSFIFGRCARLLDCYLFVCALLSNLSYVEISCGELYELGEKKKKKTFLWLSYSFQLGSRLYYPPIQYYFVLQLNEQQCNNLLYESTVLYVQKPIQVSMITNEGRFEGSRFKRRVGQSRSSEFSVVLRLLHWKLFRFYSARNI